MQVKLKFKLGRIITMVLPFLCSIIFIIHVICSFYNDESIWFSYIGGTSILVWIYLLINSMVYNLCSHHRMFIYYLIISNIIAMTDTLIDIPITDLQYLMVFIIGFGIASILYGYLKFKDNEKSRKLFSNIFE